MKKLAILLSISLFVACSTSTTECEKVESCDSLKTCCDTTKCDTTCVGTNSVTPSDTVK